MRKDLAALVRRNVEIKAAIVSADERETTGERALLNFGHTIGHAIERAGEYRDFLHGEAVSLGIVAACEISVRKAGLSETERERIITNTAVVRAADATCRQISRGTKSWRRFGSTRNSRRAPCVLSSRPRSVPRASLTDVTMEDIEAAMCEL